MAPPSLQHPFWIVGLAVGVVGCRVTDREPNGDVEVSAAVVAGAPSFPEVDLADIARRLQGTWVFRGEGIRPEVWSVRGSEAVVYESSGKERRGTFTVPSPCRAEVKFPPTDASDEGHWTDQKVVWSGGKLYIGSHAVGVKHGSTHYACVGAFSTWRLRDGVCEFAFGSGLQSPALGMGGSPIVINWVPGMCRLEPGGRLSGSGPAWNNVKFRLEAAGDAFFDVDHERIPALRVASLEEGKAELAKPKRRSFGCSR